MTAEEFDNQFDVLYNNITSNQAPGLNTYEKSVFLTKAQNEIVKNYFTANSKGNNIGQGFDDSAKRQADFSCLMKTMSCSIQNTVPGTPSETAIVTINGTPTSVTVNKIDFRSRTFYFPEDVFIVINEVLRSGNTAPYTYLQVIPLRYDEYTRLMSKPYKRPLKNQAWRLINTSTRVSDIYKKFVEIITTPEHDGKILLYDVRYIRFPKPIIVGNLDGLTINGYQYPGSNITNGTEGCELDPIIHEDILQRAVELAKVAWTATGQENLQPVMQAGQRSE